MPFKKLGEFTRKISDLPDKPNTQLSATELKEYFDSNPEEVRVHLNNLIEDLQKSTAAGNIGVNPIATSPDKLQGALEWLKAQIDNVVLGQIPDGTVVKPTEFKAHTDNEALHKTSRTIRTETGTEFRVEVRNNDPENPAVGRMYLRSDL